MVTILKVEDELDGATNFKSWKTKILFIMEEKEIDDHLNRVILEPTNDEGKHTHKKNEAKTKWILVDLVKDHLIPYIVPLKIYKCMYDALVRIFENNNPNRKRELRNQLHDMKMTRSDTIATYFMKVS